MNRDCSSCDLDSLRIGYLLASDQSGGERTQEHEARARILPALFDSLVSSLFIGKRMET